MTLNRSLHWLLGCCWWWWCLCGHAALLLPHTQHLNLVSHLEYLEDPSGLMTLDDVRQLNGRFQPWEGAGKMVNFGFTASAYWFRFPIHRDPNADQDWLLAIPYPSLQTLDFYAAGQSTVATGSERSLSSRPIFDRFFVFPIGVSTEIEYHYLRVATRHTLTVPVEVWHPRAFGESQQRFHAMQFLYFGALLVMAIYGLVIYLSIGDTRFGYYCIYIVTVGLGMITSNGYGRLFVWPNWPDFDEVGASIFFSLGAFFAVRFARSLLKIPDPSWLGWSLRISQHGFLLIAMIALLHMPFPFLLRGVNQLLMLNAIVMGWLVTMACFQTYEGTRPGVRFFTWGWLVLWLGITVASLRAFGWLPSNGFTAYAVQITTSIEMLMMALALGDLLREEHQLHLKNQALALHAKQALLESSQASEERLRQAVAERTQQLEAALEQEKHLRERYVRFGSLISHEFRTPLSIIQTQASLMRKEYEHSIDRTLKHLDTITGASQRLRVMFDKWLQSDALDQHLETLKLQPLSLDNWVHETLQTHRHLLGDHLVTIHSNRDTPQIQADPDHLGLALTNLLDNAAKYSPLHSVIKIVIQSKPGFAGFAVCDQGIGIPTEIQSKVFDEFFRATPESPIRGVGLGLSIVRRVVHSHGGHIELISSSGRGATFCVWLPSAS
jgi:two-component system, sensor histidine kinase LadS